MNTRPSTRREPRWDGAVGRQLERRESERNEADVEHDDQDRRRQNPSCVPCCLDGGELGPPFERRRPAVDVRGRTHRYVPSSCLRVGHRTVYRTGRLRTGNAFSWSEFGRTLPSNVGPPARTWPQLQHEQSGQLAAAQSADPRVMLVGHWLLHDASARRAAFPSGRRASNCRAVRAPLHDLTMAENATMNRLIRQGARRGERTGVVDRLARANLDDRQQDRFAEALARAEKAFRTGDHVLIAQAEAKLDAVLNGDPPSKRPSMNELIAQAASRPS